MTTRYDARPATSGVGGEPSLKGASGLGGVTPVGSLGAIASPETEHASTIRAEPEANLNDNLEQADVTQPTFAREVEGYPACNSQIHARRWLRLIVDVARYLTAYSAPIVPQIP